MNWLDYIIVIAYSIFLLGLGFYLKDNKNTKDYFLGGRNLKWFPLSLSTMATQLSAISFISAPAFIGIKQGGGLHWLTYELAVPLAMIFIMVFIIIPLYKSKVISIYEFLEKHFDASSRLLISIVFQVSRSFGTGVMVYAVSLILQSVLGVEFWQSILIIGVITVVYSYQGGMKAVVYGDTIQMIIMIFGIFLCIFFGLKEIGGWSEFIANIPKERLNVIDFSKFGFNNLNKNDEFGFFPMIFGGLVLYVSYYGCDQTQAQRALSANNEGTIKKLLLVNGLFRFPVVLLYSLMGLILGTMALTNAKFGGIINNIIASNEADKMVPYFIVNYLPHGIIGILIVAIIAAAMSSLSSTINSLSAVTVEDLIKRRNKNISEKSYLRYSKLSSVFWGCVCILFAFTAGDIADTVIEAINKIGSVFYGPILAMFILAILFKRVNALCANIGLITGVLFNVYLWKFVPEIFWFWWNFLGAFITISIAVTLSLFIKKKKSAESPHTRINFNLFNKETIVLLVFFIIMTVFCLLLPKLF